jgi:Xaa-Pro aminopeptidase
MPGCISRLRIAGSVVTSSCLLSIGLIAQLTSPTADTFRERRERAIEAAQNGILLIRARPTEAQERESGFRQDSTFYYLTGVYNAVGALLALDADTRETWLFVPEAGRLPGFAALMQPPYAYVEPGRLTAEKLNIDHVVTWTEFESYVDRRLRENPALILRGPFRSETRVTAAATLTGQDAATAWEMALRSRWPSAHFDRGPTVAQLRGVKDAVEIGILRRVALASAAALRGTLSEIRPGARQRHVEADVMSACLRAGAAGVSFWPWIMSGPNSDIRMAIQSTADYTSADRVMRSGELARVDIGCTQEYYSGDVGRTIPVSGRFSPQQREAWDLFVSAYHVAVRAISPGKTPTDVKNTWQAYVVSRAASAHGDLARHLVTSVTQRPEATRFWQIHHVGLDSAEGTPDSFRQGQILALEPMLSVDGIGLYLEDMILVTAQGAEILTAELPYTAEQIERAMERAKRK